MFIFNSTIVCILGLQRISFYTTSQKSNLQLIQQEMCRHPQGFMLLLPSVEEEPVPKTRTVRGSRATSGLAGGYPRTLPELPADTPRCAAGGGKAPPGLSSPALAARSPAAGCWGCFVSLHRLSFLFLPPHRALWRFWCLFTH